MGLKLRCQSKGANCPPFKHSGVFNPNNENIKRLLPDLKRCANCTASVAPKLPSLRDDLLQIASMTLLEKGAAFDPDHESRASFGTFIRPRICVSLMNAKRKELIHQGREQLEPTNGWDMDEIADMADGTAIASIPNIFDDFTGESFVDALIWDLSIANFECMLPKLLNELTPRERQVFIFIREDMRNADIAEALHVSRGRVSQLANRVATKLKQACQKFGVIEQIL